MAIFFVSLEAVELGFYMSVVIIGFVCLTCWLLRAW